MRGTTTLFAVALCILAGWGSTAAAESDEVLFRFAILSDRTGGHIEGVYPRVIEAINAQKPDLVVTVGDHIEGYGQDYELVQAQWDTALAMLQTIEAPVHMTPGNHDIWDDESEKIYFERTGRKPFYSFDHENSHFVILDNSRIDTWNDMGLSQISWLMRDLTFAQADNIFVFFHKPFWEQTLHRGGEDTVHKLLADNRVDAVFSGHYHTYFTAEYGGIDYTTIGSSGGGIWEVPQPELRGEFFQFAMVEVLPDGYELTLHNVDTGETYPQDFITIELRDEIERIESELIEMSPLHVFDEPAADIDVTISIENAAGEPFSGEAIWDVPDSWDVEPLSRSYTVQSGSEAELQYAASRSGAIYPAPTITLEYLLADGRTLEVLKDARIVRTVSAPRVTDAVAPDGEVVELERERAASVVDLYQAEGYEPVTGRTEFLFAHDGAHLFLTAVCEDDDIDQLVAEAVERDGPVYLDDCVGFFLQPDRDDLVVYQIYVNPAGTVFDQMITFDENMWYTVHPEWNGEYEIATSLEDDRWIAEIAIPFDALAPSEASEQGESPSFLPLEGARDTGEETAWGLNFRRKQHGPAASDWQVPIDYDPGTFGMLVIE